MKRPLLTILLLVMIGAGGGCQCWGPATTCLRPEGPILSRTESLRSEHLQRSHYHREIPAFDRYLTDVPDRHQQVPSRFHPVPTRNVFQQHPYTEVDAGTPGSMSREVVPLEGPDVLGFPVYDSDSEHEVMPPPHPQPFNSGRRSSPQAHPSNLEPHSGQSESRTSAGPPTHRQLIQYPYNTNPEQQVSDWVRGNNSTGFSPSLRLHSALQSPAGQEAAFR